MLVKAKWNVKDAAGWHSAGDVFHTEQDLGNAVEYLGTAAVKAIESIEKIKEPASEKKPEPVRKEVPAKVTSSRRKKISE